MFTFSLIVIVLCFAILIWVRTSDRRQSGACQDHLSASGMIGVDGKNQERESAQRTAVDPVADPEASGTVIYTDRRMSERWRDWLALTTTIIAVMSAALSLEVSQQTTISLTTQGKETNAWSYYQAKSVKEHTVQMSRAALELQMSSTPGIPAEVAERYRITLKKYDEEIKRYKDEKEDIQQKAEFLAKKRDKSNKLATGFNNAVVFLQLSIVLSALATLLRNKSIWYVSLASLGGCLYYIFISI